MLILKKPEKEPQLDIYQNGDFCWLALRFSNGEWQSASAFLKVQGPRFKREKASALGFIKISGE